MVTHSPEQLRRFCTHHLDLSPEEKVVRMRAGGGWRGMEGNGGGWRGMGWSGGKGLGWMRVLCPVIESNHLLTKNWLEKLVRKTLLAMTMAKLHRDIRCERDHGGKGAHIEFGGPL